MISNCSQCQYFDHHPAHTGDVLCRIVPAYAFVWQKLKSLDKSTLNAVPIDSCHKFKIDPDLKKIEIKLTLTYQSWQYLARDSRNSDNVSFLQDELIEHSLSLNTYDWQALANLSEDPDLLSTLAQQGIEPDELEVDDDSSFPY